MPIFKKILTVAGIILLLTVVAGAVYMFDLFQDDQLPVLRDAQNADYLNVLLIGLDDSQEGGVRPDTILFISVDLKKNAVSIISIPRDSRVAVPTRGSHYKVNAVYAHGGLELFCQTIEELFKTQIHAYVKIDFNAFTTVIDTLGGVEIFVHQHMHYVDQAGGLHINIEPGLQFLDGEDALNYVRYREPLYADIGRIQRQQLFLNSLIEQHMTMSSILKLPLLLGEITELVQTNLSLKDIVRLAKRGIDIPKENIEMALLPGTPGYINGVSYWLLHEDSLERLRMSMVLTKDYHIHSDFSLTLLNGSGVTGLAAQVRDEMRDWGFQVQEIGNADSFDYQRTSIYYGNGSLEGALRLSSLLGGSPERDQELADGEILIILGQDQAQRLKGGSS